MAARRRRGSGRNRRTQAKISIPALILICVILLFTTDFHRVAVERRYYLSEPIESVEEVPEYSGKPYVYINDNEPDFPAEEMTETSFESYSELDELGRCQTALRQSRTGSDAHKERGKYQRSETYRMGSTRSYDFVDGESLYNRCHLIGFQLTRKKTPTQENLITGTRYMNVKR